MRVPTEIGVSDLNRGRFLLLKNMSMVLPLLGTKIKQTQRFAADGKRIPVTYIQAGPCWITRISNTPNHKSVQLGFTTKKTITHAQTGHLKKAGLDTKLRFLREFPVTTLEENIKPGQEVKVADVFAPGDTVHVTGISKGKGFAGVVKRHHFKGGPRTHGQSDRERAPGSIGQTTTPGRVYRGKRMAGRMGSDRVTTGRLTIVEVDNEENLLKVQGLVPGAKGGLLIISKEISYGTNET